MPSELEKLNRVLKDNSHLNFVKRILTPDAYPRMEHGDGTYSTHLMANANVEDQEIVFPTIIHDPKTNKLKLLSVDDAISPAIRPNEFISFPTAKEADWFANNYKKVWEQ
jgi:hypothetical protein